MGDVVASDDPNVAFKDIDAAFLVGAMPRKEGMERKDLLAANVKIFKVQGEAMDKHAKKSVKVLVVGNPANTNALICSHYAPSIPKENFSAMTRLDQKGAAVIAARKLSSAMSAAKAASDHMKSWFSSTPSDDWVSMGVFSDGSYGTPEGVMFSFPVTIKDGKWSIVQGLVMSDFAKGKLALTGKELCEEREEAMAVCNA